ncbi:MAG: phosphonopyruvate decarboxylase [Gracilimonas sp.]|uniref:phosphonopyruvate decarboxylase n=1 Tax=Gracilimonas TaxID=649462 RepID=UPI001B066698|nr:phosphonopyruvate decarboxylase [Gracilimonas sp.]MBO6584706.1 phosphonopyruvate decarboxylase [Gracilimonas sp.]MBO6616023.1 phosphonopyruvate decarboxylase [Gracilimonas sp.]
MLKPAFLYEQLEKQDVEFMLGVPDSLLKHFGSYAFDKGNTLIAANEGGALAIASGYHLATGKIPLIYLQNSGFGNIVNPLTSLTDEEVYSIPALIMVGWRGKPGTNDEPQHLKPGRTQEEQLKALDLPYTILSSDEQQVEKQLGTAFDTMRKKSSPYVLLVPPDTFEKHAFQGDSNTHSYSLKREEALEQLVQKFGEKDIIVSTTGKTSRELFELRKKHGLGHHRDFLTVGSMGHASQIALGIALEKNNRRVFCIDGDGAMIMHMGALAIIGEQQPSNYYHILINNGAHESVGGQPTAGFHIDFGKVAEGCGYKQSFRVSDLSSLNNKFDEFVNAEGPVLLEIMTKTGARSDLGRPTLSPTENKKNFMQFLSED